MEILNQGIDIFSKNNSQNVAGQLLSYLGVVEAQQGNLDAVAPPTSVC